MLNAWTLPVPAPKPFDGNWNEDTIVKVLRSTT